MRTFVEELRKPKFIILKSVVSGFCILRLLEEKRQKEARDSAKRCLSSPSHKSMDYAQTDRSTLKDTEDQQSRIHLLYTFFKDGLAFGKAPRGTAFLPSSQLSQFCIGGRCANKSASLPNCFSRFSRNTQDERCCKLLGPHSNSRSQCYWSFNAQMFQDLRPACAQETGRLGPTREAQLSA